MGFVSSVLMCSCVPATATHSAYTPSPNHAFRSYSLSIQRDLMKLEGLWAKSLPVMVIGNDVGGAQIFNLVMIRNFLDLE